MTYANRSPLTAHKITGIAQIELAVQLTTNTNRANRSKGITYNIAWRQLALCRSPLTANTQNWYQITGVAGHKKKPRPFPVRAWDQIKSIAIVHKVTAANVET
jgi:hypothetical protein